jgi:arylformamidase
VSGSDIRKEISRRTMLTATAAVAATPALADACPVGPPAHEKGPLVWRDMDQVELDAAYDQRVYAPMIDQIQQRRASNSEAARARIGAPLRVSYGPSEAEKADIYRTKRAKAPVFVFIHGGAWLGGEAKNYGDSAELFVNAGAHYIALDFIAIRAAGGDLRVMANQVRSGIAWAYKNIASYDGDPDHFYVGGHSSGGHLCGVALVTDWQKDFGLAPDFIKGGLSMSGMYDMKPVRLSKRSSYVKFDDDMENAMSTQRHIDQLRAPLIVTYGTYETPEFQRQSRDFAAAVKAVGKSAELIETANYNHFEMAESLGHPYGPNGRAALRMMKLSLT